MKKPSSSRREAIEAAFRRLPLLRGKEDALQIAVSMLANVDCTSPGTPPPKFSVVGRTQSAKELKKLARFAEALAECIDTLHEPAILALANAGLHEVRFKLPVSLRKIAMQARKANLSRIPVASPGGKPTNSRAHAVAGLVAYYYRMLTGKEPSRQVDPYSEGSALQGPFMILMAEVFAAMGLHESAEHVARATLARRRESRRKPAPP